jgi:hypothetical protein
MNGGTPAYVQPQATPPQMPMAPNVAVPQAQYGYPSPGPQMDSNGSAPSAQPGYPAFAPPQLYAYPAADGFWPPVMQPPAPRVSTRSVLTAIAFLAAAILVFVGAVALARPTGGAAASPSTGATAQDEALRALWRTAPSNDLLPAILNREGTETYIRLGVNPDETCTRLPSAFTAALAPTTCARAIEATYVDRTQTVSATVGIVVLSGSINDRLRLFQTWAPDKYATKDAMMPHVYPVAGTLAAQLSDAQRVTWQGQVSSDGTYLVYAVTAFTDGRTGPGAAARADSAGSALAASSPAVQVAGDLPTAIQIILTAKETSTAAGGSGS